jgi:peptidase A4-like protein
MKVEGAPAAGWQQAGVPLMLRLATESSTNWSGYAVTSPDPATPSTFTSVTASWTQSKATCGQNDNVSSSAVWVGIGGYNSSAKALEQIGTGADCNPSGPPAYFAWYELVPDPPVSFAMKIKPGDVISTSVKVSGNMVTLQVKNVTRGTIAAERTLAHSLDLSSAEWIAEAPSACWAQSCAPLPLANFGTLKFSKITTTGNGHAGTITDPSWSKFPIQLIPYAPDQQSSSGYGSVAGTCVPTQLNPDGHSFTVSWKSVAAPDSC